MQIENGIFFLNCGDIKITLTLKINGSRFFNTLRESYFQSLFSYLLFVHENILFLRFFYKGQLFWGSEFFTTVCHIYESPNEP